LARGAATAAGGAATKPAERLRERRRRSSSRLRSASGNLHVKVKVLVAEVLEQVNLPSWSRRPSACGKRSGQRKEPVSEDRALGMAAGPWTRRKHGRRSWR
jgi:hypothetical protein